MPLEGLLELVETLRARIDAHGAALRGSEALTRYALIDPLLRELGWDTSNPDMVVPEYRVPNNQMADYVLLNEGSPAIVVESKKLDEPLQGGKALDQGILYCAHTGSKHFLLTDGRRWEIYESSSTVPRISFDLLSKSTAEVCLKALALWRPSLQSGYVATGQTPLVGLVSDQPPITIPHPTPPPLDGHEWQPLTEVEAGRGAPAPVEILLPDNSRAPIKSWVDIPVAIASWLLEKGILDASHCPIPRAKRYLLSTSPIQPDGRPMTHKKIGSLFMGRNYSAADQIKNACIIIEHIDQDPAQFKVRFS